MNEEYILYFACLGVLLLLACLGPTCLSSDRLSIIQFVREEKKQERKEEEEEEEENLVQGFDLIYDSNVSVYAHSLLTQQSSRESKAATTTYVHIERKDGSRRRCKEGAKEP